LLFADLVTAVIAKISRDWQPGITTQTHHGYPLSAVKTKICGIPVRMLAVWADQNNSPENLIYRFNHFIDIRPIIPRILLLTIYAHQTMHS